MDNEALEAALKTVIPKSLDDIILANRDEARLRLVTDQEIMALHRPIKPAPAMGRMENWRLVVLDICESGYAKIMLLGDMPDCRRPHIISAVEFVDLDRGYVVTQSSLYELGKRGDGQPPFAHLLTVSLALHRWGFADHVDVAPYLY